MPTVEEILRNKSNEGRSGVFNSFQVYVDNNKSS